MFGLPIPGKSTLIVGAILLLALATQSYRLNSAEVTIADQRETAATLSASIATARLAGMEEGRKEQKAAQDEIVAIHQRIEDGMRADLTARAAEALANNRLVQQALAGDQWKCLRDPLPQAVLDIYKRPGT